jgi:aminoglycoside phosphotransferase (APT) family kinase protein
MDVAQSDDAAFAEQLGALLGGAVHDLRRPPGGSSRLFWTFDLARTHMCLPMVVLQDVGRGPFFGTRFNLAREARTLAALGRAGARVPAVHYSDAAANFTVLERLPGRADFTFHDDAERLSVIADFGAALSALHALDPRTLDLPFAVAATRADATQADIADHEEAYHRMCVRHALVDEAFAWAKANVPDTGAPAMLQGDAGPTNFMHEGGRLTGFIDWEMAHAGDPHDDLAWIWFRVSILGFDTDVTAWFDGYARASGMHIDAAKLRYFIVLVMLRCTVANLVRQANEPGSTDDRAARTRAMLENALADARGEGLRRLPPLGLTEENA